MEAIRRDHPLRRWFAGQVEQAFCTEVGMCDPHLTDYVADLMLDFTHVDQLGAIRNARGKRLEQVASMLAVMLDEQPASRAERDRKVYRRIGDFTLFWAGLFPEQLQRAAHAPSDVLLDYVQQGKRSYAIVSELADEQERPPASLFRHLSEDFEICLYGLGLVRRSWEELERRAGESGGELIY
jgi:hypothetical protein